MDDALQVVSRKRPILKVNKLDKHIYDTLTSCPFHESASKSKNICNKVLAAYQDHSPARLEYVRLCWYQKSCSISITSSRTPMVSIKRIV